MANSNADFLTPDGTPEPSEQLPEDGQARAGGGDLEAQYERIKGWFKKDWDKHQKWRVKAKEDYEFRAGEQWDEDTKQILKEQKRPASTFNLIGAMVKAVSGWEVANRQETRYIPRQAGASGVNEIVTAAAKYYRDNCDAEDQESLAFADTATCGLGCTETLIDFDDEPEGKYVKRRVSIFEMVPDCNATGINLSDARRVHRVKKMSIGDAQAMFPKASRSELHASWADVETGGEADGILHDVRPDRYEDGKDDKNVNDDREVVIVETQWWEFEPIMRYTNPMTGKDEMMGEDAFQARSQLFGALGMPIQKAIPGRRKVYKRAFLGSKILGEVDAPPAEGCFSYEFMTGERDEMAEEFFGIIRPMKDPQRWVNKLFSTQMDILNKNAKGGIIAELDVFEDPRKAAADWAKPDSIIWARPGGLANNKIMPKPQAPPMSQLSGLMEFCMGLGPRVTGINLEFLGMREADQAGVLEYQRRQAGVTILATLFDSLRLYRKREGRMTLKLIQEYLSDGRLIRIVDQTQQQFLPLSRDKTLGEYEVIVDDAPSSPNQKEKNWQVIMSMMPVLGPILQKSPQLGAALFRNSPLPEADNMAIAKALSQPPDAEQQAAQKAQAFAKINVDNSTAEKNRADALTKLQTVFLTGMQPDPAMLQPLDGPFPVQPPQPPMMPPGGMPGMPQGMPPGMPQGGPPMPMQQRMAPTAPQMPGMAPTAPAGPPRMPFGVLH